MHAIHDRRYLHGDFDRRLHHISYFLSHVTRPHFRSGAIGLVPAHFSEVYDMMQHRTHDPIVIAAASPPDRHGYFSLGVSADYVSSFIGRARFFLEVTDHMPRTFGRNQIHVSQLAGWCRTDRPLVEVEPVVADDIDHQIAAFVAERIPNGATIQTGIGAIPNAIMASLGDHRDLGVHTELLSDGVVDLMESGVVNGVRKRLNRTKTVGTFALGTKRLHEFLHENTAVELHAVRYVNDPRIIAQESDFVSINATLSVDFLGQCASETIDGRYYSSSGGQNDFARGAMYSNGGQGFVVLHATTGSGASQDRPAARSRRCRHHAEEHGRQGGHRVRRSRTPLRHRTRANSSTDRRRASRSPRRTHREGRSDALPLIGSVSRRTRSTAVRRPRRRRPDRAARRRDGPAGARGHRRPRHSRR